MNDLFGEFLLEAEENVQALNEALDVLIQSPADAEAFKRVLRVLHNLKGGFGVFQMTAAQNACHELEDQCGREPGVHPKEFFLWLQGQTQELERLLQAAREAGAPADLPIAIAPWSKEPGSSLEDEFAAAELETAKFFEKAPAPVQTAPVPEAPESPEPSSPKVTPLPAASQDSHVRVSLAKVDDVLGSIWEIFMARNQMSYLIEQSRLPLQNEPALLRAWETLDSSLRRMVGELESQVMEMRMVALTGVYQRMSRLVQQYVHTHGKNIEFRGVGESIELDKRIVDSLADPLVHLIRNAMDHGIEDAETRGARGKPATGRITLKAEINGTEVALSVSDDGKGLDPEAIRKKAAAKGISGAEGLSDAEAVKLIFESGFSTAEKVTDISGRGVGMDAVKAQLEALSGTIEVQSEPGKGCTFLIRIPLKVSVLNSLICSINGMDYAVPHSSVIETYTVAYKELKQNGSDLFYMYRGNPIEVHDLTRYFPDRDDLRLNILREKCSLLIVGEEQEPNRHHAFLVSQICRNQELVVKPLPPLVQRVPYVAGASILAEGRPIFILSTAKLLQQLNHRKQKANHVAMAS